MAHPSVKTWLDEITAERNWYPGRQPTRDEIVADYIAHLEKRIVYLETRNSDMSWEINPDRMGGAFTAQEIEESRRGGHGW